ncbi:MAG: glycine cleavage system protein H, partial [Woeseiaceae bacterium]|nr:glycine cleavage system protein H [Woeseiaceae bacterium]
GDGWIVRLQPSGSIDSTDTMDPPAYQALLDELEA